MERTYRLTNRLGRLALRAMACRVEWTGVEHLPATGPVILAATHVSFPDFIFIEKAAITRGRYVRFMTRHDVWNNRLAATFMTRMRHIPVDRAAPAGAYLEARNLLRSGEAVGIFPEAGISHSFTVRQLMCGAGALARETGAPVIPVAIWGSQRIFTVGSPARFDRTRGRRVDLAFGAPMYVDQGADPTQWTHLLGATLTGMLEELQMLPHHRPRPGEVATWYPAHLGGHAMTRREALAFDVVPRHAITPTWGPDLDAYGPSAPPSDAAAG